MVETFLGQRICSYVGELESLRQGWKHKPQTCQPLIKENLDTHEKISGDSTKNSEILLFSRLRLNKPCFHWGQSLSVFSKCYLRSFICVPCCKKMQLSIAFTMTSRSPWCWYTEKAMMIIKNCFYRVIFGPRGIVLYPIFRCSIIFSATFLSRFFPVRLTVRIRIFHWNISGISSNSFRYFYPIAIAFPHCAWTCKDYRDTRHGIEVRLMVNIAAA